MSALETRLLNNRTRKPVHLTEMGFGAAPLGNLYRKVPETEAQGALQAAYDCGNQVFRYGAAIRARGLRGTRGGRA